jgi:hypothetical protein
MPDQTVKVTFTPPDSFSFSDSNPKMTAAGKIIMHKHPETADWTFVSVNELPSPEYTPTVTGNGSGISVHDAHTKLGSSHYTVTVHDSSGDHTSANDPKQTNPPMITNV